MSFKSYTEIQKNLGQTIKALRKTAKVSQEDLGELLSLHQTAVCRVEKGFQALTPAELKTLSDFFGTCIDSIFDETVDFDRVARKFGVIRKLPKELIKNPTARVREMLPLIQFLENSFGAASAKSVFSKFGVDRSFFRSPELQVNPTLNLGMLTTVLKKGMLNQKNLKKWVAQTRTDTSNGLLHEMFKDQQSALALVQVYLLNMHHYEENFGYAIEEIKPKSLTISVTPHDHMKEYDYKNEVMGNILCEYKKHTLTEFPLYIGGKTLSLKETDCHFKGDKRCIYTVVAA